MVLNNVERYIEFLNDIASGDDSWRETALRDEINGIIIDTIFAPDICKWETGIQKDNRWIIVKHYKDINEAKSGHKKWVELIKVNPNTKLKSIMNTEDWLFDKI